VTHLASTPAIDFHRHLPDGADVDALVGDILSDMDECGIDRTVLVPSYREIATGTGSRRAIRAAAVAADRLRAMAAVNPWLGSQAIADLREAVTLGAVGLKLHPALQGFLACGSVVHLLLQEVRGLRLPVYVHTGTPPYAQPLQVVELARQWPDITFVLGHAGSTDLKRDALVAADMAENLLVETSWTLPLRLKELVEAWGPDRVVFGSDAPESVLGIELANHRAATLPDDILSAVMGGNAQRILGWS
jgi:uncharacterized protein